LDLPIDVEKEGDEERDDRGSTPDAELASPRCDVDEPLDLSVGKQRALRCAGAIGLPLDLSLK